MLTMSNVDNTIQHISCCCGVCFSVSSSGGGGLSKEEKKRLKLEQKKKEKIQRTSYDDLFYCLLIWQHLKPILSRCLFSNCKVPFRFRN